jgi:predicted metal-dependent HD superfamily phosphohydrolase
MSSLATRCTHFFADTLHAPGASRDAWQMIEARYTEPHRRYHTLEHVAACLDELDACPLANETDVELALWFHDLVYDPKASDNEERSARALEQLGATHAIDVAKAVHLVLLTKHGASAAPVTPEEQTMIDVDLSILGADDATFDAYDRAIREEYAFVPDDLYREGRRKVLRHFLEAKSIFASDHYRERLEARARANLARALERL